MPRFSEDTRTVNLNASGGCDPLIPIREFRHLGIELTASNTTAVGTISFRLTNTATGTPKAITSPTIAVANGVAIAEIVELIDLQGAFLDVYFTKTTGQDVDMTVTVIMKD